ncbi:esterase/lipase family protein [Streptomyces sp. NPDC002535]
MARRHLLVFLPGIGGSVLAARPRGVRPPETVWKARIPNILSTLHKPHRLSVEESPDLVPTGLVRSTTLVPGLVTLPGYEKVTARLAALPGAALDVCRPDRPRLPGANVLLFPYDFRKGVAHAALRLRDEIDARLHGLSESERAGRVIVVGHSMGGLVARYWLGPLGGAPDCRALITLGTPHRGAPKALDVLVNGARYKGLNFRGATEVIRGWQGVADLLPRYPMILDTTTGSPLYPYKLADSARRKPGPPQAPLEGLGMAEEAWNMHKDIETGWAPLGAEGEHPRPEVVARIGFGHSTLSGAVWDGTDLKVDKVHPYWLPTPGWEEDRGDQTVPAVSALPLELAGHSPQGLRVPQRHGPMGEAKFITDLVEAYERYGSTESVQGTDRPDALGLDLPDAHAVGTTLRVTVRLPDRARNRVAADPELLPTAWIWIAPEPAPGEPAAPTEPAPLSWDPGAGAYVHDWKPDTPGYYAVRIRARSVPGAGDLSVDDVLAVAE